MPNELSFEVEFSRKGIEKVLKGSHSNEIVFYGSYKYKGNGIWEMKAFVKTDDNANNNNNQESGCPRPCLHKEK